MKKPEISAKHLQIMQEIVDFLQSRGWDVDHMEIDRYDHNDEGPYGPPTEEWKQERLKWVVNFRTSPQDQDKCFANLKKKVETT